MNERMRSRVCKQNGLGVEERYLLQYVSSDLMTIVEHQREAEELRKTIDSLL